MAKGRHQKDKLWQIHDELTSSTRNEKRNNLESNDFCHCALSHQRFEPTSEVVADNGGRLYLKSFATDWSRDYTCNPLTGGPLEGWIDVRLSWSDSGEMICPLTMKSLSPILKIVLNKNNGYVYSQNGLNNLVTSRQKIIDDPMDCSKLNPKTDLIAINDPEAPPPLLAKKLTAEFLKAHRKSFLPEQSSTTTVKGSGLTKRILRRIAEEGGVYSNEAKKFRSNDDSIEGYVDPITGERHLVKSRVHTSGTASASLTSTVTSPEFAKCFRYLTSREYRSIVYKRMRTRRHVNSELAVTLIVQAVANKEKFNLNTTYYAWKFPETVHQITIGLLTKRIKLIRAADEYNDEGSNIRDTLWFICEPAFDDVDDEIELVGKYRDHEPFIAAGSIFRRLDAPNAIGITTLGFPRDSAAEDTLHVIGSLDNPKTISEMVKSSSEFLTRDTVVHSNPYIECEKLAIEEYRA